MKKIFSTLVLLGFLVALFLPLAAVAQEPLPNKCIIRVAPGFLSNDDEENCPGVGEDAFYDKDYYEGDDMRKPTASSVKGAVCCLFSTIHYVTNWIFTALMAIVVLFVLVGAYFLLTAAGDPEKVGKGRNYIMFAAIGLAVALLARAVPALVKMIGGIAG